MRSDIARLSSFADYPYSGCHDRAHAVYLQLKGKWGKYLFKIWGFAPAVLTAARDGWIVYKLPATSGYVQRGMANPHWRYHVATAVRTTEGKTLVIDPVLPTSMRPAALETWLARFEVASETIWTTLDPEYYSFNNVEDAKWAKSRLLFNGGMFRYEGTSSSGSWLPKNLARDDVAAQLVAADSGCSALRVESLANAAAKLTTLEKLASEGAGDETCAPFVQTYLQRTSYWRQTLQIP